MKTLLLLPAVLVAATLPFGSPATVPAELAATAGPNDWAVDSGHSSVVFRVKHANAAWFHGTFDRLTGRVSLDPAAPEKGSVELTIPVDSIDTNDQKRDDHLRAPDFFNSKENPDITFTSTKIAKKGGAGELLDVTGELSMAGKTKTITIPVQATGEGELYGKRKGWMTEFTIRRSDFGMTYGVDKNALGDEVTLMIAIEGVQAK